MHVHICSSDFEILYGILYPTTGSYDFCISSGPSTLPNLKRVEDGSKGKVMVNMTKLSTNSSNSS